MNTPFVRLRYLGTLVLILVLAFKTYSQSNLDSIKSVLRQQTGRERVYSLNYLGSHLSTKSLSEADSFLTAAYDLAIALDYKKEIINNQLYRATYYNHQNLIFEADSVLNLILNNIDEDVESKTMANVHLLRGNIKLRRERYDQAIADFIEGLDWSRQGNEKFIEVTLLMNIGLIQQQLGEYDEAAKYYDEGLAIAEQEGFDYRVAELYLNKGVLEYFKGDINQSIKFNQQSLQFFRSLNEKARIAMVYQNLGFAENLLGNTARAMSNYDSALLLFEELGNPLGLINTWYNLADIDLEMGHYESALALVNKAAEMSEANNNPVLLLRGETKKAEIFKALGRNRELMGSLEKVVLLKDTVSARNNKARLDELILKYEVERKEKELLIRANKIELLTSKENLLATRQVLLGVLVLLLVIIALTIWYRFRTRLAQSRSKELLAVSAADNERLKKEKLEHDLQHKTQELSNYAIRMADQNKVILEFQERVNELERLERSQKEELINLTAFVERSTQTGLSWEELRLKFDTVYPSFVRVISRKFKNITSRDIDICILMKVNLTNAEMGDTLGVGYHAIKKSSLRLAQKMGFSTTEALRKYLMNEI